MLSVFTLLKQFFGLHRNTWTWCWIRVVRCPVFDRTVRFFGDLSGQKYWQLVVLFLVFFISNIIKSVATSCQISMLKCTKSDLAGALPQTPLGELTALPQTP